MKKIIILLLIALWVFLVLCTSTNAATTTVRQYGTYVSVCTQYVEGDTMGIYRLTFSDFYAKGWALFEKPDIYYPLLNKYGQYLLIKSTLY